MSAADEGFGSLLRRLRGEAGLSQERLAHDSGVSVRALADLERGRTRGPQRRTVRALARSLGLDAGDTGVLEAAAEAGRPRPQAGASGPTGLLSLPRAVHDFTARGPQTAWLHALADDPDPPQAPVVVVSGAPGLGKTSFALHSAHTLADRFPDGRLAVDLRGTQERPADPQEVLASVLRALGTVPHAVPADPGERVGAFRALVAERRILLLLDNAADEQQLRPLLPAAGSSLTIVTSRRSLAGLEAVHRIDLPMLRREESVELLTRIIGPERVTAESRAAGDLADLCGHLPLAIRIVGQRLAARPHERLAKLARTVAEEEHRLDALRAGDLQVRTAFALSYRQLDAVGRAVLRHAARAPGPDVGPQTVALLADLPRAQVRRRLAELADRGLLRTDPDRERYRFHDLVGLFAAEQLTDDDPVTLARTADATARWLLARAGAAALRFDPAARRGADPDPATEPADRHRARAWLETERETWLWALRRAHETGRHRQVVDTAEAMHRFSGRTRHWPEWVTVFTLSASSARALGDRHDEAVHLYHLARARNLCGHDHHAALRTARTALDLAREAADGLRIGRALGYGAGALIRLRSCWPTPTEVPVRWKGLPSEGPVPEFAAAEGFARERR
ncbi:helix-turn-helix domain-containing protein [Kitasatospora purpeofusca]|uniref:ATP-binding protein n=1 Tax=Kitasatospora purpeofusca TaxID=67352 RepID=UPI002253C53B|nr:XRE family transcriptional regulator [Kitasatospora purpeofusca]MCX4683420.1 helix-turn-helix domain-containing protein [Kitasatospora purpeofusca]